MEKDFLHEYECAQVTLDEITTMLWYIYEDYYSLQKDDLYTKANNYDRLRNFLYNIHSLLYNQTKEMEKKIEEGYEERKRGKKNEQFISINK